MTVTHDDIEITYLEDANKWRFELRGRERTVDSLKAAKEAIDKPAPKDKKPFEKVEVWKDGSITSYRDGFTKVTVSSVVGETYLGRRDVWITKGKDRCRESTSSLYPPTPANDELISRITAARAEAQRLGNEIGTLKGKLSPYQLPENIEE